MSHYGMPLEIRKALFTKIDSIPDFLHIENHFDDSMILAFKVAEHVDEDCDYAIKFTFTWDIPGRLLCYASVGIWNPPEQ